MVILLSDPGTEVPASWTRSIATTVYGRLRKLSVYRSVRVDSSGPLIFIRVCDSLVIARDGKSDFITNPSGFSRRHDGNFSCTYLPVYFGPHFWLVLSFWGSLFAGSIAIGMGALRHDGDRQPFLLRLRIVFFVFIPEAAPPLATSNCPDTVSVFDKLQDELSTCRSDKRLFVTAHSFSSRDSGNVLEAFLHIIEKV